MRILGLLLVIAAFPVFLALLGSSRNRGWAFVALGALPILYAPLNFEVSFISWPTWPGYIRGLTLSMMEPLALAICVRYARGRPASPMLWVFALYLACMVPGLMAGLFTPALFFVFQIMRVMLFFYAVYLAVMNGQMIRIAQGLAIAVIVSGVISVKEALSGVTQAVGILGHQNLTGLAVNLCVPLLLSLGIRTNRLLFFVAVGAAAAVAVTGGSRATMAFFAVAVAGTLAAALLVKPTGRSLAVAGLAVVGLVAALPFALGKLDQRGVEVFGVDQERVAFERAAKLMAEEHVWGAGINQFVTVANTSGYYARGGVRWGTSARATNVHNVYWLIRAEAGAIGLFGLLVWLSVPVISALSMLFRKRLVLREIGAAGGIAIICAALHSQYEWIFVTATPQYLVALMIGVIAAARAYSVPAGKRARPGSFGAAEDGDGTRPSEPQTRPAGV